MWTTIFVSIDYDIVKQVEQSLKSEGFLVKINNNEDGGTDNLYELSVLENEAMDAQDYLIERGII